MDEGNGKCGKWSDAQRAGGLAGWGNCGVPRFVPFEDIVRLRIGTRNNSDSSVWFAVTRDRRMAMVKFEAGVDRDVGVLSCSGPSHLPRLEDWR